MLPDFTPISRRVFYLLSLYIANLSSKRYTTFLRLKDLDDPLAYSNLVVPGENIYTDFGVSNVY